MDEDRRREILRLYDEVVGLPKKKRKLRLRWTCCNNTETNRRHRHRWKWTAGLCGRIQLLTRRLRGA